MIEKDLIKKFGDANKSMLEHYNMGFISKREYIRQFMDTAHVYANEMIPFHDDEYNKGMRDAIEAMLFEIYFAF